MCLLRHTLLLAVGSLLVLPAPAHPDPLIRKLNGPQVPVYRLAFSPDGKILAAKGSGIRLWDLATGKLLRQIDDPQGDVWFLAFSPDGTLLASPLASQVRLLETATGKTVRTLSGHDAIVWCATFTPDGKHLVSGSEDMTIRVWDVATGKEVRRLEGHQSGVWPLDVSPDGKQIVSGGSDGSLVLWDLASGKLLRSLPSHPSGTWPVVWSPDGGSIASLTWSNGATIHLWDVATGRQQRVLETQPGQGWQIAFSPDGKTLASGGADNGVHLWELATGKERRRYLGHSGPVASVAFSPDGRRVASGGQDGTICLWDVTGLPRAGRPAARVLSPAELRRRWHDLADEDAVRAYDAIWALAMVPDQALPLVRDQLKPASRPAEAGRIGKLITDLDDDRFAVRQRATAQLDKLGDVAVPALRQALVEEGLSLEKRRRIEQLLEKWQETVRLPEERRAVRAVEVLETVGGREGRAVLARLAEGEPEARLTRAARAALQRLDRRKPMEK